MCRTHDASLLISIVDRRRNKRDDQQTVRWSWVRCGGGSRGEILERYGGSCYRRLVQASIRPPHHKHDCYGLATLQDSSVEK